MALFVKPMKTTFGKILWVIFRLLVGFLFFAHGAQKLFGIFGGNVMPFGQLIWFAGLIEVVIGAGIFFGVFTRLAAASGVVYMIVVYIMSHASAHWLPLMNKGEAAILYVLVFIPLALFGAGKWSLEKAIHGKEVF